MSNKSLLIIIVVVLIGIFAVMALDTPDNNIDGISGSINEATEEIGDEIDDSTDAR